METEGGVDGTCAQEPQRSAGSIRSARLGLDKHSKSHCQRPSGTLNWVVALCSQDQHLVRSVKLDPFFQRCHIRREAPAKAITKIVKTIPKIKIACDALLSMRQNPGWSP
jgi:hypothetical protein